MVITVDICDVVVVVITISIINTITIRQKSPFTTVKNPGDGTKLKTQKTKPPKTPFVKGKLECLWVVLIFSDYEKSQIKYSIVKSHQNRDFFPYSPGCAGQHWYLILALYGSKSKKNKPSPFPAYKYDIGSFGLFSSFRGPWSISNLESNLESKKP